MLFLFMWVDRCEVNDRRLMTHCSQHTSAALSINENFDAGKRSTIGSSPVDLTCTQMFAKVVPVFGNLTQVLT